MRVLLGFAGTGGKVQAANIEAGTITKVEIDSSTTSHPSEISNCVILASVGSSALTLALKGQDGNNPSATSPVAISFRSSTVTSGAYNQRRITAATSLVISSGSTLGHASAKNEWIYVYALDNAGTVELAVSSTLYDEGSVQSTTAEGGAGAADSATVLYSTTARSNVPVRLLFRMKSNQTTAGTWAAVPTEISPFIVAVRQPVAVAAYRTGSNQTLTTVTSTDIIFNTELVDNYGAYDNATGIFTAPERGVYQVSWNLLLEVTNTFSGVNEVWASNIYVDGSSLSLGTQAVPQSSAYTLTQGATISVALAQGQTVKIVAIQDSGSNKDVLAAAGTVLTIRKVA